MAQFAREGSDKLHEEWRKVEEIKKDLEEQVVELRPLEHVNLCQNSLTLHTHTYICA